MKYFCDTYALVEMTRGNKGYLAYVDEELHTSILNLYELLYNLLKQYDEHVAKKYFYEFRALVLEDKDEYIFVAAEFKLKNTKKNISYADALGYAIAQTENMKFLTGDKEFQNLDNVEFVR